MTDGPSMPGGAATEIERVYEAYTPLLLSAVASLARQGYDVNPAEGLEVVHDFYLEALPGLLERYEPSRAKFSTYLYGAFVRFARPRLIRNARWKRLFVSLDEGIDHPAANAAPAPPPGLQDGVERAWRQLPRPLRLVLEGRLRRGDSERQLARRLGVSRYVVRQRLAEALGRVAIAIGRDEAVREDLRPLAIRLWRDGVPLMQVALEQDWSRHEARQRLHELTRSLSDAAARLADDE